MEVRPAKVMDLLVEGMGATVFGFSAGSRSSIIIIIIIMFILYSAFLTLEVALQIHEHTQSKTIQGMFTLGHILNIKNIERILL